MDGNPDVSDADVIDLRVRRREAAGSERVALERLRAAAYAQRTYRDELTGALRREAGRDRLIEEIDRSRRACEDLSVSFLDVVGLGWTNDERGHQAGDHLLRMMGRALRESLRSYDVVVRYGGDEFVCGLPNTSRDEAIRRFVEVSQQLATLCPGAEFRVGVALLGDGDTIDDLVGRADQDRHAGHSNLRRLRAAIAEFRSTGNGHEQRP
jgi:diguanylate cyclase (GGDEF)-like protein